MKEGKYNIEEFLGPWWYITEKGKIRIQAGKPPEVRGWAHPERAIFGPFESLIKTQEHAMGRYGPKPG